MTRSATLVRTLPGRLVPAAALAALLGFVACGPPAPVVQGRVVAVDRTSVSIADEVSPDAPPLVVDITTAEIGTPPVVGDIVRVVYRQEAGVNRALAVMNVSREERREGGHK